MPAPTPALDRPTSILLGETRAPALDGLRALFVLAVIAYHLWSTTQGWDVDLGSTGAR